MISFWLGFRASLGDQTDGHRTACGHSPRKCSRVLVPQVTAVDELGRLRGNEEVVQSFHSLLEQVGISFQAPKCEADFQYIWSGCDRDRPDQRILHGYAAPACT